MQAISEAATFRFVPPRCVTGGIDRRARLTMRELVEEYVVPKRPVIVTDATDHWPAMRKFTFEFFYERYGHLQKVVGGRRYTLAEAIDLIATSSSVTPAPYPFNMNVDTYFPELMRDMQPQVWFGKLDRVNHPLLPRVLMRGTEINELFFGGRGAAFPHVHYDALCMNTQITQIVGSKEFFLYPPEQGRYMYPRPDNPKVSQVEFTAPDLDRFPRFAHATPMVTTVQQGETLFFPAGWWHATHMHEPNITFGRAQLNGENWRLYSADVEAFWNREHPWFARVARAYLAGLGPLMAMQERLR
jgi:histone arginine demethylase JMJD6